MSTIFNKLLKQLINENIYDPPMSKDQVLAKYPKLLDDPTHLWRAETGIELIHKEPTLKEFERIVNNWNLMTDEMKKQSDQKSLELFGKTNQERIETIRREYNQLKEAKPSEQLLNSIFYHGTSTKQKADSIIKEGIKPDLKGNRGIATPVAGRTYIVKNLKEALPYCLGGSFAGHEMRKEDITKDGQFGYVFILSGKDLSDVQPDEDQVGEAVYYFLRNESDEELSFIDDYLNLLYNEAPVGEDEDEDEALFYDNLLDQVKDGDYESWIKAGKLILPELTDSEKLAIIDVYGNVANLGIIKPIECWQFDRNKSKELKSDGSNFFQLATLYWKKQTNQLQESKSSEKFYIDGLIAGCFNKNYKTQMKKYHLKVTEKFEDDPWIASLESQKNKPLTKQQMKQLFKDVQKDPDNKKVPYYYGATNEDGEEFIIFTDDGKFVPIEKAKKIGLEKGLKKEHLDF